MAIRLRLVMLVVIPQLTGRPPVVIHQLVVMLVVIHQQCRPLLVRIWKSHEVKERQLGGAIRLTIETCQNFFYFCQTPIGPT